MRKHRLVLSLVPSLLLAAPGVAMAEVSASGGSSPAASELIQQRGLTVSGQVVDEAGQPVIGANVLVRGTNLGAATDTGGRFTIKGAGEGATLVVSYVGYQTREVRVRHGQMKITLTEDSGLLDDVVVIGYGAVKKSDLAGAVGTVSEKSFKGHPVGSAADILQGRMAGVDVSSYDGGKVGAGKTIRVRGVSSINFGNDPLWVVDGVIGGACPSPDNIAHIEVLKDASSTAIYGSRGANGVILVTSKRGTAGKPQISVSSKIGFNKVPKRYEMLDAYEFGTELNTVKDVPSFSQDQLNEFKRTGGINWQDLILRTGLTQDYEVNVSGGTQAAKYFVSGRMVDTRGLVQTSESRTFDFRANIDAKVTDWFSIVADIKGGKGVYKNGTDNGDFDFQEMVNYSPCFDSVTDEDGYYRGDTFNSISPNPLGYLEAQQKEHESYNINGYADLRFKIVKGLTLSSQWAFNVSNTSSYNFCGSKRERGSAAYAGQSQGRSTTYQMTNNLTYQNAFGDHHLTATAVLETYKSDYKGLAYNGRGGVSPESMKWWNVNAIGGGMPSSSYSNVSMVSTFGRLMYNYQGKYFLTATLRADGTSKFVNKKWGWFPSAAVAWNVAEEQFMKDQDLVNRLKLRASYGKTGNQAIGAYGALGTLSQEHWAYGTQTYYYGYWANDLGAPDLTWEKTDSYDIGIDLGMLDSRLNLTFDWYRKNTSDLLFKKTIPWMFGDYDEKGMWANVGKMYSTGFEASIEYVPFRTKDFEWSTILNASYLKTRVTDLDGEQYMRPDGGRTGVINGNVFVMQEGGPLSQFELYNWAGVNPQTGNNLYYKKNEAGEFDGTTTETPAGSDRFVTGNPVPKWTFGWNNTFRYKNWEANVFFRASTGFQRLNVVRYTTNTSTGQSTYITTKEGWYNSWDYLSRNNLDASAAKYAKVTGAGNYNTPVSTQWLQDADFLRLQNLSIGYNFPKSMTRFADVNLSLSAQNLFCITGYDGLDPESTETSPKGSSFDREVGLDFGAFPNSRTWTIAVKLTF